MEERGTPEGKIVKVKPSRLLWDEIGELVVKPNHQLPGGSPAAHNGSSR